MTDTELKNPAQISLPLEERIDRSRFRLSLVCEPEPDHPAVPLNHPQAAAAFLFEHLEVHRSPQERMRVLYCDARNRLIAHQVAFVGTLNRCNVEPRPILQGALLCNAAGFVLTHNHPSFDPSPSAEDLAFTRRLAKASELVGVQLVDHIITGGEGEWISLRAKGGW